MAEHLYLKKMKIRSFVISIILIMAISSAINVLGWVALEWDEVTVFLFSPIFTSFLVLLWFIHALNRYELKIRCIIGTENRIGKIDFIKYLLLLLLIIIFSSLFIVIISQLFPTKTTDSTSFQLNKIDFIIYFFAIGVFAPIVEELVFRGILLNKLIESIGLKKAIFLSSLLFALLHFESFIIPQLLSAIMFSLVYIKTKNILYSILLHSFNNCISLIGVYFVYVNPIEEDRSGVYEIIGISNWEILFFVVTGLLVIIFFNRIYHRSDKEAPYHFNTGE